MFKLAVSAISAFVLTIILLTSSVFAQNSTTLPGGANSLSENHENWQLNCAVQAELGRQCFISQQQFQTQTNQRILAIELRWNKTGNLEGAIVMPFGLLLGYGIKLDVDKTGVLMSQSFSTCLAGGCLAPINFSSDFIERMQLGSSLNVVARQINDENIEFSISLSGFTSALNRLVELERHQL